MITIIAVNTLVLFYFFAFRSYLYLKRFRNTLSSTPTVLTQAAFQNRLYIVRVSVCGDIYTV